MSESGLKIVVVGGGAAGFFAAIAAAETSPHSTITILEKASRTLAKVRISGGGRCNVTHACFEPKELSRRYPRGGRALISPFTRFGPTQTVAWFGNRGVRLKTEADGRMFPVTDSSQTIIDCLMDSATRAGVRITTNAGLRRAIKREGGGFRLELSSGQLDECDCLLWAGGGCRTDDHPAVALGHTLVPPVPSLFTFHINTPWLSELPGVSVSCAEVSVPGTGLKERGPVLITHTGLSGPAILRLSAWGARNLYGLGYEFPLLVNWVSGSNRDGILSEFQTRRENSGGQTVFRSRWNGVPGRLWEQLVIQAGISPTMRWARLARTEALRLANLLTATEFPVRGKSMNKEEFVTCGGIPLAEVDFKSMESRITPSLYFAGEALDIDGITGGFNFQAAWTTGWIAGRAMAATM